MGFRHNSRPLRAAALQIGDTYTTKVPNDPANTVTVVGAAYADQVHTLQGASQG